MKAAFYRKLKTARIVASFDVRYVFSQELEDAAQIAERSFARTSVARAVLADLRGRVEAAIREFIG